MGPSTRNTRDCSRRCASSRASSSPSPAAWTPPCSRAPPRTRSATARCSSPRTPRRIRRASWRRRAALIGLRHVVVRTDELANPEYAKNGANRCFFCKEELFTHLAPIAEREACRALVYGANVDDLGDHRPGMQSARQRGVRAPMIEAGLTKQEIRDLSRTLGLPTWDKPSFACLSSRFQYGDRITAEKLRQIDAAEAFMRSLGFRQFRVRHHDRLARLEIGRDEMARLWEDGRHEAIVARFRELGYVYVAVDLAGFQSGSANLLLKRGRGDG